MRHKTQNGNGILVIMFNVTVSHHNSYERDLVKQCRWKINAGKRVVCTQKRIYANARARDDLFRQQARRQAGGRAGEQKRRTCGLHTRRALQCCLTISFHLIHGMQCLIATIKDNVNQHFHTNRKTNILESLNSGASEFKTIRKVRVLSFTYSFGTISIYVSKT